MEYNNFKAMSTDSGDSSLDDEEFNDLQAALAMSLKEAREKCEDIHINENSNVSNTNPSYATAPPGKKSIRKSVNFQDFQTSQIYDEEEALEQALELSRLEFEKSQNKSIIEEVNRNDKGKEKLM